jgi:hypothetical protein
LRTRHHLTTQNPPVRGRSSEPPASKKPHSQEMQSQNHLNHATRGAVHRAPPAPAKPDPTKTEGPYACSVKQPASRSTLPPIRATSPYLNQCHYRHVRGTIQAIPSPQEPRVLHGHLNEPRGKTPAVLNLVCHRSRHISSLKTISIAPPWHDPSSRRSALNRPDVIPTAGGRPSEPPGPGEAGPQD